MKRPALSLAIALILATAAAAAPKAAHAQDIVAFYAEQCERGGGYIDEDGVCLDPIEADGGDVGIDLIPLDDLIQWQIAAPTPRRPRPDSDGG